MIAHRSTREVLDDHLALAATGDLETDLSRNFAEDAVLLTGYGIFRGIDGVRSKARLLAEQLPGGRWDYRTVMAEGEMGFLEWAAEADNGARVEGRFLPDPRREDSGNDHSLHRIAARIGEGSGD